MWNRSIVNLLAAAVLCPGLGSCNLDELASDEWSPTPTFSIGGTVAGLAGPIVLQNSNGTNLIVPTDGSFTFEMPMVSTAIYKVTIAVQPNSQACSVANGSGTVGSADIRNVTVVCSPNTYRARNTIVAREWRSSASDIR